MTKPASPLYSIKHPDLGKILDFHIDKGCQQSNDRPLIFFRADDIGIPSRQFQQLIACFQKHKLPLCLATVPTWLNQKRLDELRLLTGTNNSQWCWHQHGHTHRNFEQSGKKQEFGPSRSMEEITDSLIKGKQRLQYLLGADFFPVFTPPWNRCSSETLKALSDLHFQAVSRSKGARPKTPPGLADFQVNADLHTRKEHLPRTSLTNLLTEIETSLSSGLCGIMIHHQRMNSSALELLDILLELIQKNRKILPVHFKDLNPS